MPSASTALVATAASLSVPNWTGCDGCSLAYVVADPVGIKLHRQHASTPARQRDFA